MPNETWKPTEPGVEGSKAKSVHVESAVMSKQLVVKADSSSVLLPFVQAIIEVHISKQFILS